MGLRHALAALVVALTAPALVALAVAWALLGFVLVAAWILLGFALAVAGGTVGAVRVVGRAVRGIRNYLRVLWDYYRIRGRWLEFVPPLVVFPTLLLLLSVLAPDIQTERDLFLEEYSSFLETAAQVLAALLVAIAVEARAPKTLADSIAVRPAIALTVFFIAIAELAAIGALSPFLPASLYRLALSLTVAAGIAALLAIVLVSRRILLD